MDQNETTRRIADIIRPATQQATEILDRAEAAGRDPTGFEWSRLFYFEAVLNKEMTPAKFRKGVDAIRAANPNAAILIGVDAGNVARQRIEAMRQGVKACGTPVMTFDGEINLDNPKYINAKDGAKLVKVIVDMKKAVEEKDSLRTVVLHTSIYTTPAKGKQANIAFESAIQAFIESMNSSIAGDGIKTFGLMFDPSKGIASQLECAQKQALAKSAQSRCVLYASLDQLASKNMIEDWVKQTNPIDLDNKYPQVRILLTCVQPWASYGKETVLQAIAPLKARPILLHMPGGEMRERIMLDAAKEFDVDISAVIKELIDRTGPSPLGQCHLARYGVDPAAAEFALGNPAGDFAFGASEPNCHALVAHVGLYAAQRVTREQMDMGLCWNQDKATKRQKTLHDTSASVIAANFNSRLQRIKDIESKGNLLPAQVTENKTLLAINLIQALNLSSDKNGRKTLIENKDQAITDALTIIGAGGVDDEVKINHPYTGENVTLKLSKDYEKDDKTCMIENLKAKPEDVTNCWYVYRQMADMQSGHTFIASYINHILTSLGRKAVATAKQSEDKCDIVKPDAMMWTGRVFSS